MYFFMFSCISNFLRKLSTIYLNAILFSLKDIFQNVPLSVKKCDQPERCSTQIACTVTIQFRVDLFGTTSGSIQLAIGSQWLPLNSYWKPPNLVRYWFPLISYWKPPNVFRKWFPLIDYWQPPTGFLYLSIGNHPRFSQKQAISRYFKQGFYVNSLNLYI